jgi:ATP-dependent exoDNAse (exonuclease V) alpha subunit
MAIFHLQIKPVTRSTGRSATSAAAYRAGEQIRDERTGTLYDHGKRQDVLYKEIILPSRFDRPDAGMEWARDRSSLWNAAEKAEPKRDSRVAREYQVALPPELSAEQRVVLARAFSREIADRYKVAVDLAIHEPRPQGDPRNFHAHLLATTREVTPEGLGPKAGIDMNGAVRSELGLPPSRQEFTTLRARWAELTNVALREAGVEARVDHRTLQAQGIDREPMPHIPIAAIAIERRGERSEVAERIRAGYRARVAARESAKAAEQGAGVQTREDKVASALLERGQAGTVARDGIASLDMDARRQQAVQNWLKYRASLRHPQQGNEGPRPHSMDEIRRRAVEAWRGLQARGSESRHSGTGHRAEDRGREPHAEQERGAPGLGDDSPG